ncbi:MAG: DUF1697 domain-containing protein [Herpetosiphon sp.]
MTRFIAFLRAINVGGHVVKMDHLRRLFEELDVANVETFIASGNVIFDAAETEVRTLEQLIERQLQQSLGYSVGTFVRSVAEVARVAQRKPFPDSAFDTDVSALYICFLHAALNDEAQERVMAFRSPFDTFHVQEREIYWLCRTRVSDSPFSGRVLEKTIGMPTTVRNSGTIKKLATKYGGVL